MTPFRRQLRAREEMRLGMEATNPLEPWGLVHISDFAGRGIVDALEVIEKETIGVQVNVNDYPALADQRVSG